jgi:hypothetical protein
MTVPTATNVREKFFPANIELVKFAKVQRESSRGMRLSGGLMKTLLPIAIDVSA